MVEVATEVTGHRERKEGMKGDGYITTNDTRRFISARYNMAFTHASVCASTQNGIPYYTFNRYGVRPGKSFDGHRDIVVFKRSPSFGQLHNTRKCWVHVFLLHLCPPMILQTMNSFIKKIKSLYPYTNSDL